MQATHRVNAAVLWSNLHLLCWLSLIPFATAWMGENHFAELLTAEYGIVLLMSGMAYRRRDLARHREWMLRMFAMALGVTTTRLVSVVRTFSVKGFVETLTVMSMWIGWLVTMGTAELWIRHTRSGARRDASAIVPPARAVVAT